MPNNSVQNVELDVDCFEDNADSNYNAVFETAATAPQFCFAKIGTA
jgi:hypothetical protein